MSFTTTKKIKLNCFIKTVRSLVRFFCSILWPVWLSILQSCMVFLKIIQFGSVYFNFFHTLLCEITSSIEAIDPHTRTTIFFETRKAKFEDFYTIIKNPSTIISWQLSSLQQSKPIKRVVFHACKSNILYYKRKVGCPLVVGPRPYQDQLDCHLSKFYTAKCTAASSQHKPSLICTIYIATPSLVPCHANHQFSRYVASSHHQFTQLMRSINPLNIYYCNKSYFKKMVFKQLCYLCVAKSLYMYDYGLF